MSERRDRDGRDDAEEVRTLPSATRGRPGPVHEALYNKIMDDCRAMVIEFAPQFATVTGMDGGKVKVRKDGETADRDFGVTRKRGQRYKRGDRVKIGKTATGEEFIDGSYGSKAGRDPVVGGDDLEENAVNATVLAPGSVTKGNNALAGESVSKNNLDQETTNFITGQGDRGVDAANNAKDIAQGKANENHSHGEYADKNHDHNYASSGHDHNYADKNHTHKVGDIDGLTERLRKIEDSIKKKGG